MTFVSTVNNMAESDDDVPPLEDMSELLREVNAVQDQKVVNASKVQNTVPNGGINKDIENTSSAKEPVQPKEKDDVKGAGQKPPPRFGGMKKGFLFGSASSSNKPKAVQVQNADKTFKDDIPLITAKDPSTKDSQYKMSEVQQAMDASQSLLQNKEWINDDLLDKVGKNDTLMKRMTDPKFMNAITEFQTNPTAAMAKYQGNEEIQTFIKEFCGLLGGHFSHLADHSAETSNHRPAVVTQDQTEHADLSVRSSTDPLQPTAADQRHMQQILKDPDVQEALTDPRIQTLLETLRQDPGAAQRLLQKADGSLQKKIKKLVDVGLLQFQR